MTKRNLKLEEKLTATEQTEQQSNENIESNNTPEVKRRHRRTKAEIEAERIGSVFVTEPNPLFVPVLKIPFELWANKNKLEELKLTEEEAKSLALPVTQLANYYFPKIPNVAIAWANLIITCYGIVSARLMIIKKIKEVKTETNTEEKNE